jgi:hypothetical protein
VDSKDDVSLPTEQVRTSSREPDLLRKVDDLFACDVTSTSTRPVIAVSFVVGEILDSFKDGLAKFLGWKLEEQVATGSTKMKLGPTCEG